MPTFHVSLRRTDSYTITVEAEDEQEARANAEHDFLHSPDPWEAFGGETGDPQVYLVLPA